MRPWPSQIEGLTDFGQKLHGAAVMWKRSPLQDYDMVHNCLQSCFDDSRKCNCNSNEFREKMYHLGLLRGVGGSGGCC